MAATTLRCKGIYCGCMKASPNTSARLRRLAAPGTHSKIRLSRLTLNLGLRYDLQCPSANFKQITAVADPRTLQFALRVSF
jgi:hypothetical protein